MITPIKAAIAASFFVLALPFLHGCASTQLNYNTLELASTVGSLQTRQVLFNLSQFIDNPGAIPAHVDLSAGTASTTATVSPNAGVPLSNAATGLVQTTTSVAGAVLTKGAQVQNTGTRAGATLSVTATDLWSQNWSYQPVIDGDELRRLRALYKYALGKLDDRRDKLDDRRHLAPFLFEDEYPLIVKSQTLAYGGGAGAARLYNDPVYCPDIGLKTDQSAKDIQNNDVTAPKAATVRVPASCQTVTTNIQIPDERYLHEPGCILCLNGRNAVYTNNAKLHINPRLTRLHGNWLYFGGDDIPPDAINLGRYGSHDLYIRPEDQQKLSEFTLFVLTSTAQSSAAAAAAAGSSAQKKPSGAPATADILVGPTGTSTIITQ